MTSAEPASFPDPQFSTGQAALPARIAAIDWPAVAEALDAHGWALVPGLLDAEACTALAALYGQEAGFRSRVHMARHGFGRGEYRYFAYPLPPLVQLLRAALYPPLAKVANRWAARLGQAADFPADHDAYAARCHAAGQRRPTPLLLRYGPGDYNCLHQDLYGALAFPLQAALLLSAPGSDFTGGEFILTEQRPRMQSRASVVPLGQGDAVIFAVNQRPVRGTRGDYRVTMRHGVSEVRSGARHTLGVIFHDAA
ncbi:2OG-Fe(II) oxygenase [Sphingopyxis sp. MWB1]|uniref:2OG-Fe(II) oxygenase n=1 Tax=Sphingopyxis sp. MWB1 TaxID=1537715 RepID=UPI000690239C|nr:2OG-Fe(II) oxygenase [Sphingopyxis sp. MWB1]